MAELLVDTDVLIDHLRGARSLRTPLPTAYSVVTRCELFAGRATEEPVIRELLAPLREVPVTRDIAELAGRLRREHAVRTPDALIAATALTIGASLLTRNRRDFTPIRGLRVRTPR